MNLPVFDLHCDTALELLAHKDRPERSLRKNNCHIDLERASKLAGYCQCFACFTTPFMEQWMKEKNHASAFLGLGISLICLIAFGADDFIIPSMLAILGVLTLLRKPLEKGGEPV